MQVSAATRSYRRRLDRCLRFIGKGLGFSQCLALSPLRVEHCKGQGKDMLGCFGFKNEGLGLRVQDLQVLLVDSTLGDMLRLLHVNGNRCFCV